jgi:4-amino-4-deoxy-L-arabinose transferase-like glycosyltransferase
MRHDAQRSHFEAAARVNLPTPAIATERSATRLPRLALILFCAAYVLPGLFGRAPWRNADVTAFGFMASIAKGLSPWWEPNIAGVPSDGTLLPYWMGALFIKALPFVDAAFAARLPFGLALVGVLMLTWYSSFHLARTDAAQPVAFAFGGEAHARSRPRALADGSLLALIASLGLLQLGHETTPELAQLLAAALLLYGLAAAP